jgi:hypothetical protein
MFPGPNQNTEQPLGRTTLLKKARNTRAYRGRLKSGLWELKTFLARSSAPSLRELSRQPRRLDTWLERFVEFRYGSGAALQETVEAILACQRECRVTRQAIPAAWASCWTWRSLQPLKRRNPWPYSFWQSLVVVAMAIGTQAQGNLGRLWIRLSVLWRLAFATLLRPGEVLNLRRRSVKLPRDLLSENMPGVVIIEAPKNSQYFGRQQFVLVDDPSLLAWMSWDFEGMQPDDKLWPSSRQQMVKMLQEALRTLHMEGMNLTLGGLRAGGATYHFQVHRNLGTLQFLGRWRNATSMQHYLQEAVSALICINASEPCRSSVEACLKGFKLLIEPPSWLAASVSPKPAVRG